MLRVIEGGLSTAAYDAADAGPIMPNRQDVQREADRRLKAAGYETWTNRERLTGMPVPRELRYLAMQIGFVAEAIGGLADIPSDFRSDFYWPA